MLHGRAEGTLRIGVTRHRSGELLPQIVADFFTAYPGVRLDIRERDSAELEQLLLEGELDMALLESEKHHGKLEYRQIASEEVVLLAGKKTALAQRIPSGTTIGLREAAHERFVLPFSQSPHRAFYEALMTSCDINPVACVVCDSVSAAMRMCVNCSLVTFAPFISLLCDSASLQRLNHYHLGTDAYLPPFYIAYPREAPLAPYAETLFSLLSSRFRAMTAYRP